MPHKSFRTVTRRSGHKICYFWYQRKWVKFPYISQAQVYAEMEGRAEASLLARLLAAVDYIQSAEH